ncbi:hypothetical protein M758_4G212500, partial [Ceratodon purpureus]
MGVFSIRHFTGEWNRSVCHSVQALTILFKICKSGSVEGSPDYEIAFGFVIAEQSIDSVLLITRLIMEIDSKLSFIRQESNLPVCP